jgi:Tfp pilus assembly protein PilZ
MRILLSRFRDGAEFLNRYRDEFLYGGIFYPSRSLITPGEVVVLDCRMPGLGDHMLVRGLVAWHRRGRRSEGVRAGLGIEFLASEQDKRDYLLALARGELDGAAQRRHRRLPVELPVDWRIPAEAERHISLVDDISTGGAFIRTVEQPPTGTPVVLDLVPPGGSAPQSIEARVAWTRSTPGQEGVGVEFRCRDIAGLRRLRELVKRLERADIGL